MSFRRLRILLLLGALTAAVSLTWLEQWIVRGWRAPLEVQVIPINGDGSARADDAIAGLRASDFEEINVFLEREVSRYGAPLSPAMQVTLMPQLDEAPPPPPTGGGSALDNLVWSLKLRWWVYRQSGQWMPQLGTIKLFLLYHTGEGGVALAHSLGLQKGLIGVINVFADSDQRRQNNIVVAHELLHTLGATDKYGVDGRPVYPEGYVAPELPQSIPRREAEIMAGRYLDAAGRLVMPPGLDRCVIGATTAREINLDAAFQDRYGSGN